jgi:hypothetical protein
MKIIRLLKKTCLFIIFFTTTFLLAQDKIIINEKLPSDSEKLELILPKIYWFNKSKIQVANYGVAKIKEGITSTETTRKKGVTYSETKQKITIILNSTENESSSLIGRTVKNDEYIIKDNYFLNRVLDIGVESETILSMVFYPKTLKAAITTNIGNSKSWDFLLKTTDQNQILNIEIGRLTAGERTINVIQTNLEGLKNINENDSITARTLFYEFIENGISLGAVTFDDENSIWLKPGLDSTTKLILCTAMLSIAY